MAITIDAKRVTEFAYVCRECTEAIICKRTEDRSAVIVRHGKGEGMRSFSCDEVGHGSLVHWAFWTPAPIAAWLREVHDYERSE